VVWKKCADLIEYCVPHRGEVKKYGPQSSEEKQLQKALSAKPAFYHQPKTEKGDAVKDKMPDVSMTENMGKDLPPLKLVTIGIKQIQLIGINANIGQCHLRKAYKGHDNE
jgi:hypothetical protein